MGGARADIIVGFDQPAEIGPDTKDGESVSADESYVIAPQRSLAVCHGLVMPGYPGGHSGERPLLAKNLLIHSPIESHSSPVAGRTMSIRASRDGSSTGKLRSRRP